MSRGDSGGGIFILIIILLIVMCCYCCRRCCRQKRPPIYSSPVIVTSVTHQVAGSNYTVQSAPIPQQSMPMPFTGAYPPGGMLPQTYGQPNPGCPYPTQGSSPYHNQEYPSYPIQGASPYPMNQPPIMMNPSQNMINPSAPYVNNPNDDLPPSYNAATVMKGLPM